MKTATTAILILVAGSGCLSVGTRNSGNMITIDQRADKVGQLPDQQAIAVNGNNESRQGASGVIVNNFYIGPNSSTQAADKTQGNIDAQADASGNAVGGNDASVDKDQ